MTIGAGLGGTLGYNEYQRHHRPMDPDPLTRKFYIPVKENFNFPVDKPLEQIQFEGIHANKDQIYIPGIPIYPGMEQAEFVSIYNDTKIELKSFMDSHVEFDPLSSNVKNNIIMEEINKLYNVNDIKQIEEIKKFPDYVAKKNYYDAWIHKIKNKSVLNKEIIKQEMLSDQIKRNKWMKEDKIEL